MLVILLIYALLLLVWTGIAGVAIYQNMRYFEPNSRMRLALHAFIWVCAVIFVVSLYMLSRIDWTQPISIKL